LGNDRYSHPEQAERLRSDLVHLTGSFDRLDVWRDTIKKKGQKSLHSPLYVLFVTAKLWLVCSWTELPSTYASSSLVPRPSCQLLWLAVQKVGEGPGRFYCVMRATADVT